MKFMAVLAAFALSTGLAWGAANSEKTEKKAPSPAQKAQQEKMKTCNAEAGKQELKGDERKKFMSACLKAKPAQAAEAKPQQEKMETCSADAGKKGLKGEEHKKFLAECLKAGG